MNPDESISLADPDFMDDPVRTYARLRDRSPMVRIGLPGSPPTWLVTRFEDVRALLADQRFVVDIERVPGHEDGGIVNQLMAAYGLPEEFRPYAANMTFLDGKDLSRLRRLVTPVFSARRIKAMRPRVEEIVGDLTAGLAEAGGGDVIGELSSPLTSTVICDLIGVDAEDQPRVREWMHAYTAGDYATSAMAMVGYFRELVARRRAEPTDDMISMLIASGEDSGDRLSEAEIIAMALLMVNNGHLSTAHFIPNSVLLLFDHPDQLARLRAEPELMPKAIHELMRVTNPATLATPRYATEDLDFAGITVRRGEALIASLQSANFDPNRFRDPERFDITRDPGRAESHIAFGAGPHYCLGAALGRLEGEVALTELLLRRTGLALAVPRERLEYTDAALGVRLLRQLPVRL